MSDLILLLRQPGANPKATADDGMTPVKLARTYGNSETVEALERHGSTDV
jgi:ankyrin repeat protein